MNPSNIRTRVLAKAADIASAKLVKAGGVPLPHLTPHSCRRTFASVLYALGESPATVMAELGHTNPALALTVYAQAMRRDAQETERLRALVEGSQMAAQSADKAASIGSYWQTGKTTDREARAAQESGSGINRA